VPSPAPGLAAPAAHGAADPRLLVQEYAQLKRERGWIDMGDLERAALALMTDEVLSGWVQERLDARVRHLLIDEFQDTNPLQWQALSAWLDSYGGAGNAPSVFVVGDPKQSIYRFRRAEPQVFKAAQRFVVKPWVAMCWPATTRGAMHRPSSAWSIR
jgi:ATP-dependent helicase/nuclease subunit A